MPGQLENKLAAGNPHGLSGRAGVHTLHDGNRPGGRQRLVHHQLRHRGKENGGDRGADRARHGHADTRRGPLHQRQKHQGKSDRGRPDEKRRRLAVVFRNCQKDAAGLLPDRDADPKPADRDIQPLKSHRASARKKRNGIRHALLRHVLDGKSPRPRNRQAIPAEPGPGL